MAPPRESLKFRLLRHVLAIYAAVVAGWLGLRGGSALIDAIAAMTDRDCAELADMVMWSSLAGAAVGALAGIWLVLLLTKASREAQKITRFALAIAFACGAVLLLVSYDWPKSSGRPVVQYELQLPAGMPLLQWPVSTTTPKYTLVYHIDDAKEKVTLIAINPSIV